MKNNEFGKHSRSSEVWVEVKVPPRKIYYHDILRFNGRCFIKREKLKELLFEMGTESD